MVSHPVRFQNLSRQQARKIGVITRTHFLKLHKQHPAENSLLAGHKLGGTNGESVDLEGVCQMVIEVLDGALAGDDGLDEEAKHGEHGKTAILDLLDLYKNSHGSQHLGRPLAWILHMVTAKIWPVISSLCF